MLLDGGDEDDLCFLIKPLMYLITSRSVLSWSPCEYIQKSLHGQLPFKRVKLKSPKSDEVSVLSGMPHGSVIGLLLILMKVNYHFGLVSPICLLFAEEIITGGRNIQRRASRH